MRFQAPRGTADVLPGDAHRWVTLETAFREITSLYGYGEIRTPTFEDTGLFTRTVGETSDIVTKQMYTFEDKGGRSMTLKPEGTAPVIRAALEHNLFQQGQVTRLSYVTACYRYERPQKGRLRELHQFGLELVGSSSPAADAEVIEVTVSFYRKIGIGDVTVLLNSIGGTECRAAYRQALLEYVRPYVESLDEESRGRVERNPLRVLDSKDPEAIEAVKGAPLITDFLEEDSKAHFEELQSLLSAAGIVYKLAPEIVRGLDYYTGTVFEVHSNQLGAQGALCGGGRYDGLIEELGGPKIPSVGVGMGIERALIVLGDALEAPKPAAFLVEAGPEASELAGRAAAALRQAGISVVRELDSRAMKAQMKTADRLGVSFVLLIGESEVASGLVSVKSMATGKQESVAIDQLASYLREN